MHVSSFGDHPIFVGGCREGAAQEPLKVTGASEWMLLLLLMLTCMSAVAAWEACKAIYKWAASMVWWNKALARNPEAQRIGRD